MSKLIQYIPEHHAMLLRIVIERVETAYLKAVRDRLPTPAVFVLDFTDRAALEIAHTAGRNVETDRFAARGRENGTIPVALWHMPADAAADRLPAGHAETAAALRDWAAYGPPGSFPVITIGAGSISLVAASIP